MTEKHKTSYDDSIPFSLVAHWMFCPRRAWLEAVDETMPQSSQVAEGTYAHRRVDKPTTVEAQTMRGVDVRDPGLGTHGRIDRVEFSSDTGNLCVVEHKATPVKQSPTVSEANVVQLALQTMALEAGGAKVGNAEVYFSTHHKRIPVEITKDVKARAAAAVEETRKVISNSAAPKPLLHDPRCMSCSHASICLPDERQETVVQRRIVVPDPGAETVHLTVAGCRARLSGGRVVVEKSGEKLATIPIERVAAIIAHGNIDLSGALLREFMWRGIPTVWCTGYGRVVGWTNGVKPPNGGARFLQFQASANGLPDVAKEIVSAKIGNQATIFRRFGGGSTTVAALRNAAKEANRAESKTELFGAEGSAAAAYFSEFPTLLTSSVDPVIGGDFPGRVGRGAVDCINVALNYGYGMLLGEVIRGVLACGLDPHAGILHSSNRNKPALALDLMEEFRSPLVDAAVLTAFNNREIGRRSFNFALGGARFTAEGRKKLISTIERRLSTEFTHPVFGYRLTWRRAIEVQARMFLGVLDGTQATYKAIRIR